MAARKHTLMIVNPGHFHAALTLRKRHPLLSDEVYVFAEDGPDLSAFIRLVRAFNYRSQEPTDWGLHVYRGPDYLEALLHYRPGEVAVVAGPNDTKLATITRLHEAGIHVLGDKTWVVDATGLDLLDEVTSAGPLAMDIMTERFEIATRLQCALTQVEAVFGGFRTDGADPAICFRSVHHLYKEVNGEPLIRPSWYFDTSVQGEGITDVTTHLVDLAQWMVAGGAGSELERGVVLTETRQWSTDIPLDVFNRITGQDAFPAAASAYVSDGVMHYPCNANIGFQLRGVSVRIESVWDLAIPPGGGDTHYGIVRGNKADLVVDQGAETGYVTRLRVVPAKDDPAFSAALHDAVRSLAETYSGIGLRSEAGHYHVCIPDALRLGHEAHFSQVLDQFLVFVDEGKWPRRIGEELNLKYRLLADAYDLSHGKRSSS